jgi:hypothetical protein
MVQWGFTKELAPNLYIITRFNHRSVHDELKNLNWIRSLGEIHSTLLLEEFTFMFMPLSSMELSNQRDIIQWRSISNAQVSIASAYEYQFQGSFSHFAADGIWQAATVPKCKFFDWLVMHNRVLTVDNMTKKNWPCNHQCLLCLCLHETTDHLLVQCSYSEVVWNLIAFQFGLQDFSHMSGLRISAEWYKMQLTFKPKKERQRRLGILFTSWWLIWKERNTRVF